MAKHSPKRLRPTAAASRTLVACALLVATLVAGEALAACNLTVSSIASTVWTGGRGRGYEVYDSLRRTQLVGFRLTSNKDCPFYLTIAPTVTPGDGSGDLSGPGGTLGYELYRDASGSVRLKPVGTATESEVYSGIVQKGGSGLALQFVLVLPPEQVVAPGTYIGEIEFVAYEGTFGAGVVRDRRKVAVTASVPSVVEISFTGGGSFDPTYNTYALNFGNLKTGDRRTVGLKARGNGGYRLRLGSQNGGRLRHVDPGDSSVAAYGLTVDGATVDLTGGPADVATNSDLVPATGDLHLLEFSVGNLAGASSGDYKDVIDVTVLTLR